MRAAVLRAAAAPFVWYNTSLNRRPLSTKSLTSGVMYGLGDVFAQVIDHRFANASKAPEDMQPFSMNWTRAGVTFLYGTVIAGPLYHIWFGSIDKLPTILAHLYNSRQRAKIIRAFAFLKRSGFDVKMDPRRLPDLKPFSEWKELFVKIIFDQLVFSSLYLVVYFVGIGLMQGAAEKLAAESRTHSLDDTESLLVAKQKAAIERRTKSLELELLALKDKGAAAEATAPLSLADDPDSQESIDRVLALLREERAKSAPATWATIWDHSWDHMKQVFRPTFVVDCAVWPALQLVNFKFVPLQYRVLYVNVFNLAWNTFLSMQANKPPKPS